MAYTFERPHTAKYSIPYVGTSDREIVDGGNAAASITPAFAATQINKLYAIVGVEFATSGYGVKRTMTEIAEDE